MTPAEQLARAVLAAASVFDARIREPDPNVVRAWAAGLDELDPNRALAAVAEHYRASTETLMVGHITEIVNRVGGDADRHPSNRTVAEALAAARGGRSDLLAADRDELAPAIEGPQPRSGAEALAAAKRFAQSRSLEA